MAYCIMHEDDDTHWIPANHGEAKGALMPEKTFARCQVAKGALIMPGGQRLMTATESEFERNVLQRAFL